MIQDEGKKCPFGACDGSGTILNRVPFGSTEATERLACECGQSDEKEPTVKIIEEDFL